MSKFLGSTVGDSSLRRASGRISVVVLVQFSPASSERKMPAPRWLLMTAYRRWGLLGATAISASTTPSGSAGKPFVSLFQVVPPSVDLKMPPVVPDHAPFSQGPCRASHNVA